MVLTYYSAGGEGITGRIIAITKTYYCIYNGYLMVLAYAVIYIYNNI